MTGLQHFEKEQKSNPQSHVSSPFVNSLGIISGLGSFRGQFGDHFRAGDHFGVGIISGAVHPSVSPFRLLLLLLRKLFEGNFWILEADRFFHSSGMFLIRIMISLSIFFKLKSNEMKWFVNSALSEFFLLLQWN